MDLRDEAGVAATLKKLQSQLREALDALHAPQTKTELDAALHDDQGLPDAKMAGMAAETVDMLAEIQQMLEPAHLILADHFLGYTNSKCLVAAVALGVPDALADGPKTLDQLATTCAARPDRLRQIMRPLYNNGIFRYEDDNGGHAGAVGKYAHNHVSRLLQTDHWTQWHNWVDLYGNEFYEIACGIPAAVRADSASDPDSGPRSAAQIHFKTDLDMFRYFEAQGWTERLHRTLGGGAVAMAPGIVGDYPWHEVAAAGKTVMDIGGGGGGLVASLLRAHPTLRGGGIYDLPAVIAHVSDLFAPGGRYEDLAERVPQGNLIAGDFLKWVPPAEVYTMKWVLHDWMDDDAVTILANVRKAIVPGPASRLVVMESILSDGRMGRLSRYGDINMMMTANGRERTEAQWRMLAERAGWRVEGIYPLRNSWVQAIDLRP